MSLKELPRLNIRISTNSWSGFKSHLFSFLSCFIWGRSLTVWPWLAWTLLYVDVLYKIHSVASASWLLRLKVYVPHPTLFLSLSFFLFGLIFQDKVSQVVLAVVEFTTKTRLVWNSYRSNCFCLLNTGIKSMSHSYQLLHISSEALIIPRRELSHCIAEDGL